MAFISGSWALASGLAILSHSIARKRVAHQAKRQRLRCPVLCHIARWCGLCKEDWRSTYWWYTSVQVYFTIGFRRRVSHHHDVEPYPESEVLSLRLGGRGSLCSSGILVFSV